MHHANKDGTSPLHIAASARPGNMRMVKYLVEKCHAVILTTSNDGITPISAGTDQIASYLKQQLKERIMKVLMQSMPFSMDVLKIVSSYYM